MQRRRFIYEVYQKPVQVDIYIAPAVYPDSYFQQEVKPPERYKQYYPDAGQGPVLVPPQAAVVFPDQYQVTDTRPGFKFRVIRRDNDTPDAERNIFPDAYLPQEFRPPYRKGKQYGDTYGPCTIPVAAAVVYPDSYFQQESHAYFRARNRYDLTVGDPFPLPLIVATVYPDSYWEPDHRPANIKRSMAWRAAAGSQPDIIYITPPIPPGSPLGRSARQGFSMPAFR